MEAFNDFTRPVSKLTSNANPTEYVNAFIKLSVYITELSKNIVDLILRAGYKIVSLNFAAIVGNFDLS